MGRRGRGLALAVVAAAALGSVVGSVSPAAAEPSSEATPFVAGGSYVSLTPTRIADTRTGLGAPRARTTSARLQVGGVAGVPQDGVAAVVLNVTVVEPAAAGYLSVTPTGTTATSNVNFRDHQTVAQLVTTKLDAQGRVAVRASAPTHVVADVVGWFTDRAHLDAGGTYHPVTNRRLVDTRTAGGPLATGRTRRIPLTSVPAGATAAVVNVTAVRPKVPVYVTTWGGGDRPVTSTVNAVAGEVRANRAIVPVAPDGSISVMANGPTDLVVDLNGWFVPGRTGASFLPTDPTRITDSRKNLNSYSNYSTRVPSTSVVSGLGGLPPATALFRPVAAWLSATVVTTAYTGWVGFNPATGGPYSEPPPTTTSDINFGSGVTSNALLGQVGVSGAIALAGHVELTGVGSLRVESVLDLSGWFVDPPPSPSTGLWVGGVEGYPGNNVPASQLWNRRVPGPDGDIVQVAATEFVTVVRYRDGTVRISSSDHVWDTDAVDVAASFDDVFVVKRDGTVWVNGPDADLHGLETTPSPLRYGPVPGVTDAVAVTVGWFGNARALRRDGTVVTWGREKTTVATPMTAYGDPVVSSAANPDDGGCVAYADGSVAFDRGHRWQDTDTADHVRTIAGVGAVRVVAQPSRGCYAIDARGRLHQVDFLDPSGAESTPTDVVIPSPPVADLVLSEVSVQTFHGIVKPTLRVLGTDGRLYDRVGDTWSQVEGMSGVTALGASVYSLIAWSPGPNGDGS